MFVEVHDGIRVLTRMGSPAASTSRAIPLPNPRTPCLAVAAQSSKHQIRVLRDRAKLTYSNPARGGAAIQC